MLQVLYDVSLLGIAHRNRSTFGLSRTTEALLRSLMAMPDELKLSACSDVSYNVWLFSRLYLAQQPLHEPLPWLSNSLNVRLRNQIKDWFLKDALFTKYVAQLKKIGVLQDEARAYEWRLKFLEYQFRGTPQRSLAPMDIYHSNYHAIPECVQRHKKVKAILTVHDIIPILHPEWCGMLDSKPGKSSDLFRRRSLSGVEGSGAEGNSKAFHPEFNLPATLAGLRRHNWIICPSETTRHDVCEYLAQRIDPAQVRVIPWAASALFYPCTDPAQLRQVRQTYQIPDGHYLLSLSAIEPRKNLDTLIGSFYRLLQQERISDLWLVLAGPLGWDYAGVFQAVSKHPQLAARIIFTGYVAEADIAALYSAALAFVYPSLYEGFGLPPLEAMQCGTPVITSAVSSLPEVVGTAGLLVNPRDTEALAASILKLYRSPALRAELSRKGIERAACFSWQQCAQQTVELYQQALEA